jgi:hypothetical protein
MREDLERERKFMIKLWAKRKGQIINVIKTTAGMYRDMQGIAGRALPEIENLGMPLLDAWRLTKL